jgi:Holliday junction resolvase RusA-like endonuclease
MIRREFFVEGHPVPQSRPRFNRRTGRVYSDATPELTAWKEMVAWAAKAQQPKMLVEGRAIHLMVEFHFDKPKRLIRPGSEPFGNPDPDNLLKPVMDQMQGIIYKNDNLITRVMVIKKYCDTAEPEGALVVLQWSCLTTEKYY